MKNMKTTLAVVALATCASTQVFATTTTAKVKQDVITISMSGLKQSSVSTSASLANAGKWTDVPFFYKTTTLKVTDQDVIKYIGAVMYKNPNHYSSKAKLVLVQGELSGFFNITPNLAQSTVALDGNQLEGGTWTSADNDVSTSLAASQDSTALALANGRHWDVNPINDKQLPVGHLQPWGQIYVQDPTAGNDNVTFLFALSVQECYDCFYLNSFVSTSTFKTKNTSGTGAPPCCSLSSTIIGNGKDSYYLTLSFDNTDNNPYLDNNEGNDLYVGDDVGNGNVTGLASDLIIGDGIVPDTIYDHTLGQPLGFRNPIQAGLGKPSPYEARFTLNGVLTYTWNLNFIDNQDISPDFLGTGSYVANGYGFIGLYCSLFNTATVTFKETAVNATAGLAYGTPWYEDWYGVGAEYVLETLQDGSTIKVTAYQKWIDTAAGVYNWGSGTEYPTAINVSTSLTYHENFNNQYPANGKDYGYSAWPSPAWIPSWNF